eukprot:6478448-Amphidinium_carterae.1
MHSKFHKCPPLGHVTLDFTPHIGPTYCTGLDSPTYWHNWRVMQVAEHTHIACTLQTDLTRKPVFCCNRHRQTTSPPRRCEAMAMPESERRAHKQPSLGADANVRKNLCRGRRIL